MGGWRSVAALAVLLRDDLLEFVAVMLERAFVLNSGWFIAMLIFHLHSPMGGAAIGARWRPTGIIARFQRRPQISQMRQIPQTNCTPSWLDAP